MSYLHKIGFFVAGSWILAMNMQGKELEGKTSLSGLAAEENTPSSDGTAKKSGPIEVHDYGWEMMSSIAYQQDTGNIQRTGEDKVEKMTDKDLNVDLQMGRLQGDNFEPILGITYNKADRIIGTWKSTQSTIGWGLGVLFNIPISPYQRDENFWKYNAPLFGSATWIPYGGFMIESKAIAYDSEDTSKTTLKSSEIRSKLIFGTRYMLFTHVALNTSVSVAYDSSKDEVTEKKSSGGTLGRVLFEAKLLSFSILF